MSWWNWQDDEPNEFACGRIATDAWAENDCTEQLRYICERGKFFIGNIIVVIHVPGI